MIIREMEIEDVKQVHEIEKNSFVTPWSEAAFERELKENKFAKYLVIEEEGQIVAYGGMWWILDEAHVTNIAVSHKDRKKGYGKRLVQAMMDFSMENKIVRMTLEVRVSNKAAIQLYQFFGFEIAGTRKGYYTDTKEDAYIMWCELGVVGGINE